VNRTRERCNETFLKIKVKVKIKIYIIYGGYKMFTISIFFQFFHLIPVATARYRSTTSIKVVPIVGAVASAWLVEAISSFKANFGSVIRA
jgi:hypothetical protein